MNHPDSHSPSSVPSLRAPSLRTRAGAVMVHPLRWVVFASAFALTVLYFIHHPAVVFAGVVAVALVAAATDAARDQAPRPVVTASSDAPPPAIEEAALARSLLDPTLVLRRSGRIAALNSAAQDVFPSAKPDAPVSFVIRAPDVLNALDEVRRSGLMQTARLGGPGGRDKAFDVALSLLPQAGAEPVILMQLRDVTQAERIEKMRTDFIANASHELRTPLASVLGFIETLQGPARNDAAARERFLDIMGRQARRMSRLIDDLLSLSKVEERAHVRPRAEVDVWSIVRQVTDGLAPLAKENAVEIKLARRAAATRVRGDQDELTRVFENLIENAIKYGRDGGSVEVDAHVRGDALRVVIRDHGPGIPPEHLPRLTERFYRVDVADSRDKGGTGLGLALAKNVLLRHRGRLLIASTAGEGASFTVELPLGG